MTPNRETSRDLAYRACTEIFLHQARFPTVDLVVEAIGVNNRRLVSEVLKLWRQDLAQHFREHQIEVPEPVRQLWRQALAEAHLEAARERFEKVSDWASLRIVEERERIAGEWSQKLTRMRSELERAQLGQQMAESRLRQAEERIDRLIGQLGSAEERLAEKDEAITRLTQENLVLAEERAKLAETVARLERESRRAVRRRMPLRGQGHKNPQR